MPIVSTNQPKMGFSFALSILLEKATPNNIPITEMEVNVRRKTQSILTLSNEEPKPIKELIEMIKRAVATASFIEMPNSITSAGTMRKPPPAPINPVMIPTINPCDANIV